MQSTEAALDQKPHWLDRRLFFSPGVSLEVVLYIIIILVALFSRTYILGARVMSHDENTHVYYSWRYFQGYGFQHDPLMHGPFLFHITALSYFMFGDTDFTARLPQALFSVAAVGFLWFYRRYLGRTGALLGAVMMLISPYMMFYGRYARNEAYIQLFGVVMIWAILRYLETGLPRYLYLLTTATVLHFTSKETSFIYTAIALLFLGGYFLYRIFQVRWPNPEYRSRFLIALLVVALLAGAVGGFLVLGPHAAAAPPAQGDQTTAPATLAPASPNPVLVALLILVVVAGLVMLYFLFRGLTLEGLRADRAFGAMLVLFTLVLPQLAAFPLRWVGWKTPVNAGQVAALNLTDILHIAAFVLPLAALSILVGLLWNPRMWLINAAIWYGIFTVFYTSLFTNGAGFFTGLIGSLGYWLEQQGVNRGSQPHYYYWLIQVPVYEYLPALGAILAFGIALYNSLKRRVIQPAAYDASAEPLPPDANIDLPSTSTHREPVAAEVSASDYAASLSAENDHDGGPQHSYLHYPVQPETDLEGEASPGIYPLPQPAAVFPPAGVVEAAPVFPLLGFWAITSLIAYSVAGEKMPWLTVHIALPLILCAAWAFNRLVDGADWNLMRQRYGWVALLILPVFLLSFFASIGSLLGPNPPFQGQELVQLQATSQFLISALFTLASGAGLFYLISSWPAGQFIRYLGLSFFTLLAVLTVHTAVQANFYNYDDANELLVYAHAAPGDKIAMAQIEEISQRTTDGKALKVAYDNETSYPYWWYLRNYPNAVYYGATPSRTLRDDPVILVGDANFGKIEPVVGNLYDRFDYIRLWWPNQDYFDLTPKRILNALSNPAMRKALFEIWLNRDYTEYGKVVGRDMSLPNWSPAARMRLYIRKDVAATLWNYGASQAPQTTQADPFEEKHQSIASVQVIGAPGNQPGQLQRPRDIAVAKDGSLYVADTDNSRIQHLSANGDVLQVWGSFGDAAQGATQGGQLNQPWGIGLGPDGSVYVADTWNHRIQKFTADGKFISMWGYFGQGEQLNALWGPRDVAVDSKGRVFVTDTGNKRVVVFDADGHGLASFGGGGMDPGQFDEPVGITIDANDLIYVADTWNQRIQVFQESSSLEFQPVRQWDSQAWYGQSLDNKPYITAANGFVFAADPEGYRVLQYTDKGDPVRSWGDFGADASTFGLPASVAIAPDGSIWVVDSANSRMMRFVLPQ